MSLDVRYGETIIVGTTLENKWSWFISEVETWILDYDKFERAFGLLSNTSHLNWNAEDAGRDFLEKLSNEKVSSEKLSNLLKKKLPAFTWDDLIEFCPSLLVNFDKRILKSLFPESTRFEEFAPDNWEASYANFLLEVPLNERYWIINGKDYFEPFINPAQNLS